MAAIGADIRARDGLHRGAQSSSRSVSTTVPVTDLLTLDPAHAVRVVVADDEHRAEPVVLDDGVWRRAVAGDGAGVALLQRLYDGTAVPDGFRISSSGRDARAPRGRGRAGDGGGPDPRIVGRRRAGRREVDDRAAGRTAPGGRPSAPARRLRVRRVTRPVGSGRVA